MKLELKNLKVHADMSQETNCFSATLYANAKLAGSVSNSGHGGSHRYQWDDVELGRKIDSWAESQPMEFEFEKLDQLVDRLILQEGTKKELKRKTKKTTWFRLKGDPKREFRTVAAPYDARVQEYLDKKYPGQVECIVNADLERGVEFAIAE